MASAPDSRGASAPAARGGAPLTARAGEWIWRRDALAQARARARTLDATQRVRCERARTAAVVAERVLDPDAPLGGFDEALPASPARALAVSLYREAAAWALLAYAPGETPDAPLAAALERAPADVVRAAAGGDDAGLSAVRRALVERDAVATAALDAPALDADVAAAQRFVRALLDGLEVRERVIPRLLFERVTRVAMLVALAVVLAMLVPPLLRLSHRDWIADAAWRTSSTVEGWPRQGRGASPRGATPSVFFHTQAEPSPWIEFDLGAPRTVSYLAVGNRGDCCAERAVPLVFELSDDARTWREVARRTTAFDRWTETFPRQTARYARLRSLRSEPLHLESVELR